MVWGLRFRVLGARDDGLGVLGFHVAPWLHWVGVLASGNRVHHGLPRHPTPFSLMPEGPTTSERKRRVLVSGFWSTMLECLFRTCSLKEPC